MSHGRVPAARAAGTFPFRAGGTVVVGVDGSEASVAALRWAVREAELRRQRLRLVYAFPPPALAATMGLPARAWPGAKLREPAVGALNDLVARIHDLTPAVVAGGVIADATPAAALLEESRTAALVVVGAGRSGGVTGLRLGSVANHVTMHASCPVVVVPAEHDPARESRRSVVVGADGSLMADLATGFAFDEAAHRGVPLVAVRAWTRPDPFDAQVDRLETAERAALATSVVRSRPEHRDVAVEYRLVAGPAVNGLLVAAGDAQLLVIGSRGMGELRGMLLGSVGLHLLHRAPCPVAVMHPHRHAVEPVVGRRSPAARHGIDHW